MLLKVDSATGQPTPQFSEEQMKTSNEAMRTEVRAKYDYKKGIDPTAQAQLQEQSEGARAARAGEKEKDAAAGAWNQLYTGKTAAEKKAAADILLGTPIAQQAGLLGIDMTKEGKITLKYADPVKNRTIDYLDTSGNPISLRDFSGLGVELHGVVDRDKAVKAGGGGTGFGRVADLVTVTSQRQGSAPQAAKIEVPLGGITSSSGQAVEILKGILPPGFTVEEVGLNPFGNDIEIVAPDKKTKYPFTSKKSVTAAEAIKKDLENWITKNQGAEGGVMSGF